MSDLSGGPTIPTSLLASAPAPSGAGCVECEEAGGWWFRLRRCVECGHVGCCDSSLGQHGRRHFEATGHRYLRSYEPGESWFWDFENETDVSGGALPEPQHHPIEQTTPGPESRVPDDWEQQLSAAQAARES